MSISSTCENPEAEIKLLKMAVLDGMDELTTLSKLAMDKKNVNEAKIFAAHEMLLRDEVILNQIIDYINANKCNAQYAVSTVCHQICSQMRAMQDALVYERIADVEDVCERILRILNHQKNLPSFLSPFASLKPP